MNGNEESLKSLVYLGTDSINFWIAIASIFLLFTIEYLQAKFALTYKLSKSNPIIRFSSYSIIILIILYFGVFNRNVQFIYFQF